MVALNPLVVVSLTALSAATLSNALSAIFPQAPYHDHGKVTTSSAHREPTIFPRAAAKNAFEEGKKHTLAGEVMALSPDLLKRISEMQGAATISTSATQETSPTQTKKPTNFFLKLLDGPDFLTHMVANYTTEEEMARFFENEFGDLLRAASAKNLAYGPEKKALEARSAGISPPPHWFDHLYSPMWLWLKGVPSPEPTAVPSVPEKRNVINDLEIAEPTRDSHWAASILPRETTPRTEKVLDALTTLDTRVKTLNTAISTYTSGFRAAIPIQTAIQALHSASLNTNDAAMLLPPLNAEDSKKIVEYIRENIVVDVLASVAAMKEKAEELKKAKLSAVVVVTLKSLREDYDRPSMVLAGKIVEGELETAKSLLKTVDDAILEGIKGFEE